MSAKCPIDGFDDLDLVGYLYNACYGGFGFSGMFMETLRERQKAVGLKPCDYEPLRMDQIAVALVQEMGSELASDRYAAIRIKWVPREFLADVTVEEYDGTENVSIDFQQAELRVVHDFMEEWRGGKAGCTVADLDGRLKVLRSKRERYEAFVQARR